MVRVLVASKTVWSHCYIWAISERWCIHHLKNHLPAFGPKLANQYHASWLNHQLPKVLKTPTVSKFILHSQTFYLFYSTILQKHATNCDTSWHTIILRQRNTHRSPFPAGTVGMPHRPCQEPLPVPFRHTQTVPSSSSSFPFINQADMHNVIYTKTIKCMQM